MFVLLAVVQRVVLPALIAVNLEPLFIKDHQTPQQQRLYLDYVQRANTAAQDKRLVLIVVQEKKQALMALGQQHVQHVMLVHTATAQQTHHVPHAVLAHINLQRANHHVAIVVQETQQTVQRQHAPHVQLAHTATVQQTHHVLRVRRVHPVLGGQVHVTHVGLAHTVLGGQVHAPRAQKEHIKTIPGNHHV